MGDLGTKVKLFRTERKISQYDLSRATGIEQATISRIERGQMDMLSPHATRIADALGVPLGVLLGLEPNVAPAHIGVRRIPVLEDMQVIKLANSALDFSEIEATSFVLTDLIHSAKSFAMRVQGNSMEKEFQEGDLIVIDPSIKPSPGDYCVATGDGEICTFRQFRDAGINDQGTEVFELVPLNPLYAPMRSDRLRLRIVGTLVEHRKYRKALTGGMKETH